MHGRPRQRAGQAPSPLDKQHEAAALELQKLMPAFLESNRICCYSVEAMNQNARLLELNPEFYTAWNYRKRAVREMLEREEDEEARKGIVQRELDVAVRALRVNPKCYGAWYHRQWVMGLGLSSLDAEFVLLKKLLKLDARNFHGWNYRRFVATTKGVSAEDELLFTTEKINENFSNYSAWHNRSALLSEISENEGSERNNEQARLDEEYELVKNSFYTDPDDQSGWFYYCWLLERTLALVGTPESDSWLRKVFHKEIASCRELLELESNSKWTRLTLARLLLAHASYDRSSRRSHMDEARTHFEELCSLDPTHQEYYQHKLSVLSWDEMTEDKSEVTKDDEVTGKLRLRSHGLCSLGFTERLSWVRHLDLSHNQLRSTHGLEELRALVSVDLSHNRVGSVAALAALRALPSLQTVDVAFNQIGDHTVDTCRQLFPFKLSNRGHTETNSGALWEVKAVFEGLQWESLNITGNTAARDPQFVETLQSALVGTRLLTEEAERGEETL